MSVTSRQMRTRYYYFRSASRGRSAPVPSFRRAFGPHRWRSKRINGTRSWIVATFKIGAADTTVVLASGIRETSAAQALHSALEGLPQNDAGLLLLTDDHELLPPAPKRFRSLPLQAAVQLLENGSFEVDARLVRRTIGAAMSDTLGRAGRPSLKQQIWNILDAIGANPEVSDLQPRFEKPGLSTSPTSSCPARPPSTNMPGLGVPPAGKPSHAVSKRP